MTSAPVRRSSSELEAGLPAVLEAPRDEGALELIVRRPRKNEREVVDEGTLTFEEGLAGDDWRKRKSARTPDGAPHPECQVTLMSSRVIALIAGSRDRWPLAGDQLYADLDLSAANLQPGARLQVGEAVLAVSALAHTGCKKFAERFGLDALKFVNSPEGRRLNLRGVNARVLVAGTVRVGDRVRKLDP